jgi:DNA-binding transcriptional regulator LsrR (DeoR family)
MRGSKHRNAILNEEQVLECRKRYFSGGISQQKLADKFGIGRRNMGDVINGVTWAWLK